MKKMLDQFADWGLNNPGTRHKMVVNASHGFAGENAMFLVLAWDYVFNPADAKLHCLRDVFIASKGKLCVNLPSRMRSETLAILATGEKPKDFMAIMSASVAPVARGRGMATMGATAARGRAMGASARPMAASARGHAGGFRAGGAGNYNLATQALVEPVCEISTVIKEKLGQPRDFHAAPKVAETYHYLLAESLPMLRARLGADLDSLI